MPQKPDYNNEDVNSVVKANNQGQQVGGPAPDQHETINKDRGTRKGGK